VVVSDVIRQCLFFLIGEDAVMEAVESEMPWSPIKVFLP
jgi:hypothetical protein